MNPKSLDCRRREQDVAPALGGLGFGQDERLVRIAGCLQLHADVEGLSVEVAPADSRDFAEPKATQGVEHEQGRQAMAGEGIEDCPDSRDRRGDGTADLPHVTPGEGGRVVVDEPVALGIGEGTAEDRAGSCHGAG